MKYVKRLYYLAVLMALMGIYNNASVPDGLGDSFQFKEFNSVKELLNSIQAKPLESQGLHSENVKPSSSVKSSNLNNVENLVLEERVKLRNKVESPSKVLSKVPSKVVKQASSVANFNPRTGLYEINGKPYVYFKSAYRPYKEKNIYYIDGVYYNYIPKPLSLAKNDLPSDRVLPEESHIGKNSKSVRQNNFGGSEIVPQPGGVLNANNLRQLNSELAKAKKNMEYKNQALQQLLKE